MATPPDFSVGQVLTSAAMNQVGLWLIKTQAIASGATSVDVTSVFSSDFKSYRVVFSNLDFTAFGGNFMTMRFNTSGNNHFSTCFFDLWSGTQTGYTRQNAANIFTIMPQTTNDDGNFTMDIINPNVSGVRTGIFGQYAGESYGGFFAGNFTATTALTGFTIFPNGATLNSGTIKVYGYRN